MSVFNRLIGAVNRAVRCAPHGGSRDVELQWQSGEVRCFFGQKTAKAQSC